MERKPSVASDLLSVRDEHLGVYALGPAMRAERRTPLARFASATGSQARR